MGAARKTTLASRLQVPKEWDGLVGRTEEERREIEERIDRVFRAKDRVARAEGEPRELSPVEIAIALGSDRKTRRVRCPSCKSYLPMDDAHFWAGGLELGHYVCRTCKNRRNVRYQRSAKGKARLAAYLEAKRAHDREYQARKRERMKRDGIKRIPTARERLINNRRDARLKLSRATDPARIEALKARVANLTHEIERIDQKQAI